MLLEFQKIVAFGSTGEKEGLFLGPKGIAEDLDNNIWVADEFNHRIQKFDPAGNFILAFGKKGNEKSNFFYPTAIVVDHNNNLFVSDRWNHRIQKFDSFGNFILAFGSYGTKEGQFNEPWGLSISSNHQLYVCDSSNHRIQIFSLSGDFVACFGKGGPNKHFYESNFFQSGFIFQQWLKSTNKFNTIESFFYKQHYETGLFEYPQNIFLDQQDNLFVADYGNQRIMKFNSLHEPSLTIGKKETLSLALPQPTHVALSGNIYFICLELENQILITSLDGTNKTAFSLPKNNNISYFLINRKEELFIADATDNKIWKFKILSKQVA